MKWKSILYFNNLIFVLFRGKEHALLSGLDTGQFCRDRDMNEIVALVEVLVGAAVQCSEKAQHVKRIMNLSVDSQSILQALIQSSLSKMKPLSSSASEISMQSPSSPPYVAPASVCMLCSGSIRCETDCVLLRAYICANKALCVNASVLPFLDSSVICGVNISQRRDRETQS